MSQTPGAEVSREATLHDVARHVGVSTRTVSRVVNNEGGFSDATRTRVNDAIAELGYRPNLLARGLITKRSGTIGLIAGDMTDPFFPEVADGVQRVARELGLTMFFASTDGDRAQQRSVLESMRSHAVDGVLVFPAAGTQDDVIEFAQKGLRFVTIDEHIVAPNIVSVTSDIIGGAELAVRHLHDRGRRRVAMIANADSEKRWRERGYHTAVDSADATPLIERTEATTAGGMAAMERLLDGGADIDAVFVYNDLMALGAMRVLAQRGVRVPDDVAVVGFDNIEVSAVVTPSLTTINLDRMRLGRQALETLQVLRSGESTQLAPVTLPVELVVRESS